MARRIRTAALQASGQNDRLDGYCDRVLKYVPADVVAAWITVTAFVPRDGASGGTVLWIAFAVGILATALWTAKQTGQKKMPPAVLQIAVASAAFAVWVIALGRPFDTIRGFEPYYGPVLLVGFTVISGFLVPKN